jgi:hypothetical protein
MRERVFANSAAFAIVALSFFAVEDPGRFYTEPTFLIVDALPSLASSFSEQQFHWAHAITLHAIVGLGLSAGLFVLFLL